jgi:hypothetical protein
MAALLPQLWQDHYRIAIKLDTLSSKNSRTITENLADSNNAVIKD